MQTLRHAMCTFWVIGQSMPSYHISQHVKRLEQCGTWSKYCINVFVLWKLPHWSFSNGLLWPSLCLFFGHRWMNHKWNSDSNESNEIFPPGNLFGDSTLSLLVWNIGQLGDRRGIFYCVHKSNCWERENKEGERKKERMNGTQHWEYRDTTWCQREGNSKKAQK
jgi:hypothetical protein